jgi:hypothetical protein
VAIRKSSGRRHRPPAVGPHQATRNSRRDDARCRRGGHRRHSRWVHRDPVGDPALTCTPPIRPQSRNDLYAHRPTLISRTRSQSVHPARAELALRHDDLAALIDRRLPPGHSYGAPPPVPRRPLRLRNRRHDRYRRRTRACRNTARSLSCLQLSTMAPPAPSTMAASIRRSVPDEVSHTVPPETKRDHSQQTLIPQRRSGNAGPSVDEAYTRACVELQNRESHHPVGPPSSPSTESPATPLNRLHPRLTTSSMPEGQRTPLSNASAHRRVECSSLVQTLTIGLR